jgi:hypothetical protein
LLFILLMYIKCNCVQNIIAALFERTQPEISKIIKELTPVLETCFYEDNTSLSNPDTTERTLPDEPCIEDVTEISIPRSCDNQEQRLH